MRAAGAEDRPVSRRDRILPAAGPRPSAPDPAGLRWLARHVLSPAVASLADEVAAPVLLSAHLKQARRGAPDAVRAYLLRWATHPRPGSNFEKRTRWLRRWPHGILVRVLLVLGYDGILYRDGATVLGHLFFQRHGDALHAFSLGLDPAWSGGGRSVVMILDYVAHATQVPGIARVRLGTGTNTASRRALARLRTHAPSLGWRVEDDGWVTFARDGRERGPR